jgi:hypothetical protein
VQLEPFAGGTLEWAVGSGPVWLRRGGELGGYLVFLQRLYISGQYTLTDASRRPRGSWNSPSNLHHQAQGFFGWRFLW